ncbi:MAG: hypothetical protein IPM16_19205 [Chloroflexi bacterium]|nr:hypothetical protein [Chloroflexota bacterium]
MSTPHVNSASARTRSQRVQPTVTEPADSLVRAAGLPFRQAHRIVSGMVTHALKNGLSPQDLGAALLGDVAEEVIGRRVEVSDTFVQDALNPEQFVLLRAGIGGAAPSATAQVLTDQREQLNADVVWLDDTTQRLANADHALEQAIAASRRGVGLLCQQADCRPQQQRGDEPVEHGVIHAVDDRARAEHQQRDEQQRPRRQPDHAEIVGTRRPATYPGTFSQLTITKNSVCVPTNALGDIFCSSM